MAEGDSRKLIYCVWEDITSSDSSWRSIDEAQDYADETDSLVREVGFLISKDENYLVLCTSYIPGLDLIGSVVRIPVVTIKQIVELPVPIFQPE